MSENTESTNAPAIYGQLAQVMADCTHVAKRDVNQHQRFLFRGIDAVVNAVGPILRNRNLWCSLRSTLWGRSCGSTR